MQHPLRRSTDLKRITDRVMQSGAAAAEQAGRRLGEVGRAGNEAARGAYRYAMNHPRSTAAVVLGTAAAAALIWMLQRSGSYAATRRKVQKRVRQAA